jgi:hypothetical protein
MISRQNLMSFQQPLAGLLLCALSSSALLAESPPKTLIWEGDHLAAVRAAGLAADSPYKRALERLRRNADAALQRDPYSVMDKGEIAPSGDKHDYLSYARYWWPNPKTKDGLPYIRRDGLTNHDILKRGDRVSIGMMYDDLETLALAAFLLDDARYAEHAVKLVRTWFLDPATKMNPNLQYGQAVPGLSDGRGSGIIDTRHFIRVVDAVKLLGTTESWKAQDQTKLTAWMKQYLDFLLTSPRGAEERSGHNNHATWYDAQVATLALYVGEVETAKRVVESAKQGRIAIGIEPDGSQPAEIARTKGLHYCVFNLSALSVLARIGEQVGVDLWNYQTSDGRSIRGGLDFVMPYLTGKETWPHEQIEKMAVSPSDRGLFYLAARAFGDPHYLRGLGSGEHQRRELDYASLVHSPR